MYKLFLCLRYLRKRRIAFFAVAAVCLCVAMVLIVRSVMGGFLQMVKDRSRGMLGDLVVENGSLQGFAHYDEFINDLKTKLPSEIDEATPVIISYGVLRFTESKMTKPVQIVGIKLDETYLVNEFKSGLFYEKYYPGTTNFGEQKIPGYGLDAQRLELARRLEQQGEPDFVSQAFHATGPGRVCAARADPERVGQVAPRGIARREEEAALAGNNYGWVGNYHSVPPREGMSLDELAAAWWGKSYPGAILGTDLCAERKQDGSYDRFCYRGEPVQITFVPFSIGRQHQGRDRHAQQAVSLRR